MPPDALISLAAAATGHPHARLFGRGTTALYAAFRALALLHGPGEIILPDLICSTVFDAVLLAGHTPILAAVLPGRWTIDPADVRRRITGRSRAVLVAHLFGHVATVQLDTFADLGLPIIEDAIQGFGGAVGRIGRVTILGFAPGKMIGGRGSLLLTSDAALWQAVRAIAVDSSDVLRHLTETTRPSADGGPDTRFVRYRPQVISAAPELLRAFDDSETNCAQIEAGWHHLPEQTALRNANARYLADRLTDTCLQLSTISDGDAVWRFTIVVPTVQSARWIARHLQGDGLPGSRLYPSLSALFTPDSVCPSAEIAPRLLNLWVDQTINRAKLDQMIAVIRAAPGIVNAQGTTGAGGV